MRLEGTKDQRESHSNGKPYLASPAKVDDSRFPDAAAKGNKHDNVDNWDAQKEQNKEPLPNGDCFHL